jgi:two-component system, LuxR family, response regulator FixJ
LVLQSMKFGAFDFIEKPAAHQQLLDAVQDALTADRVQREKKLERARFAERLADLTQRERQVLDRMITGMPNKTIAGELDISERTLEKHRKNILEKMGARTVIELVRVTLLNQPDHCEPTRLSS